MCHSSCPPRSNPVFAFAMLIAAASASGAGLHAARADGGEVDELVVKATREFVDGEWDAAKKFAEAAETAAKKAGLAGDAVMARVYMLLGAVQVAGFNNPGKAIESFRRALAIDAGTKLTKAIAKPEVIKAFKSAVIMSRAEAASAAAHPKQDTETAEPKAEASSHDVKLAKKAKDDDEDKKAEDKKDEQKAEDKKAEKKAGAEKKAEAKAEAKIEVKADTKADTRGAGKAKKDTEEDEDEDEDVSLEELRRRARAAKGPGKGNDKKDAKDEDEDEDDEKEGADPEKKVVKKAVAKKEKPKPAEPEEPDLPVTIPKPLHCPNPDEAPPHQAAILRCVTQPGLTVGAILLFYRLPGSEEFVSTPATKTKGGWYVMTAPGDAFTGKFMQYYFEARDASDKPISTNGKWDSPNLMLIRDGAPAIGTGALAGMRVASEAVVMSEENPLAAPIAALVAVTKKMWVALSFGTGGGYSGNSDLEWYTDMATGNPRSVAGGFRSAGTYVLAAAFGYELNETWALSLETRNQFISRAGSDSMMMGGPATGAHSILLKGTYMRPLFARMTLLLSAAVGIGEGVRFVVDPEPAGVMDRRTSSDSVSAGPLLLGGSAAVNVLLWNKFSLRVTLPQMLMALPKSALIFDVGAGLVYHL